MAVFGVGGVGEDNDAVLIGGGGQEGGRGCGGGWGGRGGTKGVGGDKMAAEGRGLLALLWKRSLRPTAWK